MDIVEIKLYQTYISLKCSKLGILPNNVSLVKFINKYLTSYAYNYRFKRWLSKSRFCGYSSDIGEAKFPRYSLPILLKYLDSWKTSYKIIKKSYIQNKDINIKFKDKQFKITDVQKPIIDFISEHDEGMIPISAQTGSGKALSNDTLVKIPGGWKVIKDIKKGDIVTSSDGSPSEVIGVYPQGKRSIFKVTFADDRFVNCDLKHLWKVAISSRIAFIPENNPDDFKTIWQIKTTEEMIQLINENKHIFIPTCLPEDCKDKNLPIVPFELGKNISLSINDVNDITEEYLHASFKQRFMLYESLIQYNNPTLNKELVDKIVYLGRSLGYMITVFKDNYGRYTFYEFEGKRLLIKSVEYVEENECTCIKIAHPDGLYVVNDFIVTHNTAIAIKSICNIKKLPMIIVRGLVQQWKNEFLKFTNLNEKDIYIIQGIDSIVKLKKLNYYPKIFICSLNTCRNWLYNDEYKKIITYQNFLEEYKIAIKVIDECHRDFHTLVQIDLCSNVQHNIYLSATYGRTDSYERNIFNMIFPPDIVFNEGSLEKYVKVYFYNYSLGYMKKLNENTIRGYSQSKYEQYILKHESIFNRLISNVLLSIIEQHFFKIKRPIEKLLILVHTIDLADAITEKLMEEYGDMNLNIKRYTGPDPVSNLNDGTDIIISTPSSSGTGVDIKHLRTVILMDSFASSILTKQIFGRLRKLEDNVEPEFIDMFNRDIEAHIRHKRFRSDVYYKLAKEYHDKYIY